MIFRQLL